MFQKTDALLGRFGFLFIHSEEHRNIGQVNIYDVLFADGRATRWYFAEGTTKNEIATWICIQNPTATTAFCTVTYMKSDSSVIEENIEIDPTSRFTINVNAVTDAAGDLAFVEEDVSTKVVCTNGVGIVAERAMYRDTAGIEWAAAHACVGVPVPSTTWYLAEGSTRENLDTWICIQNPEDRAAEVQVTFMRILAT